MFKIWDADILFSRPIGFSSIKISALCINGGSEIDLDIFNCNEKVGDLTVLTSFSSGTKKADLKEVQQSNDLIQQEIDHHQKENDKILKQLLEM